MGEAVVVAFGVVLAVLVWLATGRLYARRSRRGRWVYGVHHGPFRWHMGSATSHREVMARIEELRKRGAE